MSASLPTVSGDIDVAGAMPSVDVDKPSASASVDVSGECVLWQVVFFWRWSG